MNENKNQSEKNLVSATKSGRAFNGFEKDKGIVVHLVEGLSKDTGGYWGNKSVCGIYPGIKSNGWHEVKKPITCPKCIMKQIKNKLSELEISRKSAFDMWELEQIKFAIIQLQDLLKNIQS